MSKQPVIIIGMHRSGTTMLARLLEQAGLFQGWKKEINFESTFFIKLNDWILRELGGRWDIPQNMVDISKHPADHLNAIVDYLKDQLGSPRAIEYLGVSGFLRKGSVVNQNTAWGWKDPRNTLTLDFWLKIFPEAKIIHIMRNGVDVASSLRVRSQKHLQGNIRAYSHRRWLYSLRGKKDAFSEAPGCLTLAGGFSLWQRYVTTAMSYRNVLNDRYFEIKYEDLLASPYEGVREIVEFCGLERDKVDKTRVDSFIDQGRGNRYKLDAELNDFSIEVRDQLGKFGY